MFRQKKSFAKSGEGVQSPVSKLIFKISFRLLKMHYILEVEIDEEKIKTPIETNQQSREIAEIEFVEFECSWSTYETTKCFIVVKKNEITFWTISKFGYIYWKWLDPKKWLDTDVCSQGIKRVLPLPLQIQKKGDRMCSGLSSRLRLRDNRKKRKRQGGNKRGGFSESAPGTCYVTWNRAIVSPIPVQLVLESMDKHLLTSGKDPSLLFTTQRYSLWWNFLSSIKAFISFD